MASLFAAIAVLLPLLPPPGREGGVMVAMGHGLCVSFRVSGEMMKNNKVGDLNTRNFKELFIESVGRVHFS